MIKRLILPLLSIASFALNGCATAASDAPDLSEQTDLFAAMAMTGDQQASSTPTDSGLMLLNHETHDWERLGPQIMFINSAVADPNDPDTLFFACGNGIARTTDGGETWRLVTGWRESDVMRIVIDPTDSDRIYAASIWGVTISRDGGETWKAANTGLPEYYSKDIVLDERDPDRLLLATTMGLFESTDRAENWSRVEAFPEVAILRLERSTINPDLWIAGTEGRGVWLSTDDGRTWRPTAPDLASANVYGVALDPADPARMAAGGWGTGVHVSTDGGSTWTRAPGELPSPNITAMIFDRWETGRLWVSTFEKGTFHSDDAGATWSDPTLVGAYVFDLGYL
jgi:ligand-binding sensor domain-containing protein